MRIKKIEQALTDAAKHTGCSIKSSREAKKKENVNLE